MPERPLGVFDVLDATLATEPHSEALVTTQRRCTYEELDTLADRAAGALHELGVRPGDRIAASLPNDLDIVVAFHGAMRLGAIWVGINRVLAPPEKEYMIKDSGAVALLADDAVTTELAGLGTAARIVAPAEWSEALQAAGGKPRVATPDPGAPAAIAYTSGTTGFPKGAVHCQAGMLMPGAATVDRRGWGRGLRKGDSLPLTILNMQILTTLLTAQAGGTAVIIDKGDVASIVRWIRDERVSVWNGPPAQLYTMVRDDGITRGDLVSLDEVWVGGGDCPDRLKEAFESKFGVRVSRTYGLTEAPALVSIDDMDGDPPPGTSGRPLDHIRVAATDGELLLGPTESGPWAGRFRPFLEYWHRSESTEEVLAGGVLHTGDLGSVEPSGHLRILGRRNHLIIRGGANVYPAEVERVLSEAPGVGGCAVVGVPDERLGERVGAVVEPAAGAAADKETILEHCRLSLAAYKVPERLAIVDRLPRNAMGKVPRGDLVEILAGNL